MALEKNRYYLDDGNDLALIFSKGKGREIEFEVDYLGDSDISEENLEYNLRKLTRVEQDKSFLGDRFSLYVGKERFAGLKINEEGEIDVIGGGEKIKGEDKNHHLTYFEIRMLSKQKNSLFEPFNREELGKRQLLTDLHTHYSGCLYAEDLIEIGLKHNVEIRTDKLKLAGIDTEKFGEDVKTVKIKDLSPEDLSMYEKALTLPKEKQETFNKMEEIYSMRGEITKSIDTLPDILERTAERYREKGIVYAELSLSDILYEQKGFLKKIHEVMPDIERRTGCKLRFLAAMSRHSDKEWNQDDVDRIKCVAKSPYVVGMDVMGHETNKTEVFGEELSSIVEWAAINDPSFVIRVHAGENPTHKDNVKDFLKIVKESTERAGKKTGKKLPYPVTRIGHGVYGFDEETVSLCKEIGAVVEFNMASNLSLNNIDKISDIPIAKYAKNGIKFVLGSDGMGIYSTSPKQDVILANAANLTAEDWDLLKKTEIEMIINTDRRFVEKRIKFENSGGIDNKDIFKTEYSTPDGKERYTKELEAEKNKEKQALDTLLSEKLSKCGAETSNDVIEEDTKGKTPILITGASLSSWGACQGHEEEIKMTMHALVEFLDKDKAYIVTGGTNHGVEKLMHEEAQKKNKREGGGLVVLGTLTKEAVDEEIASIEKNTITHAMVLSLGKKIAEKWHDLPDMALEYVSQRKGEVIAIGGGSVVRDMIQRGHNMGMSLHLMQGPKGASTDKAEELANNGYNFDKAEDLIKKLYQKRPEIFKPDFYITEVNEYIDLMRKRRNVYSRLATSLSQIIKQPRGNNDARMNQAKANISKRD